MSVTPEVHPAATIAADELQPITSRKTYSAGRLRLSITSRFGTPPK
jgi:hypothetical protein